MVAAKEALVAMRLLLLSVLLLPLANLDAEVDVFNVVNERRVMIITGAGGEEEYTELFAKWGGDLACLLYTSDAADE